MIQRIQTLWLALAAVCAFLGLKLPFYLGTNKDGLASYKLNGTETMLMLVLTVAIGIIAGVAIFIYRDRKTQMRLCIAGILLEAFLMWLYYQQTSRFLDGAYALTSLLQAGIFVFFFLAIVGIRKDNQIIKESNRLR